MSCQKHEGHMHKHGADCGHTTIQHEGHTDYLHDGHMHHVHGDHVDDHVIAVSAKNPNSCSPGHDCGGHNDPHKHGPGCGHPQIPHGDHADFLVAGHLHHVHGDHCDDHGPLG